MTFRIYRDSWGIPHIRANDVNELAYAQGYNAASDRAWQLEVERQRAQGTSASFLGSAHVDWDVFARRARLGDTARRCFQNLKPKTKSWIRAYVQGVNAAIGRSQQAEFRACNITPEQWAPWTPLSIWFSSHILLGSFAGKLWREEVYQRLGEDHVDSFSSEGLWSAESNGWFIPGALTASGFPMLAGDPHRIVELPGCYQQIHLACDDYELVGFAVPGIPGIAHFGHAGSVSWSITNAMADYQDVFREKIERHNNNIYCHGPKGLEKVVVRTEIVEVADGDDLEIEIMETKRGPIIIGSSDDESVISLRVPARAYYNSGFDALPELLHAKSVSDIDAAFEKWVEPVNIVQAADTSGNFLYRVSGIVPDRNFHNHIRVVPAWEADYEWKGVNQNIKSFDSDRIVVMANHRGLAGNLGIEFSPPHRMRRIHSLLSARDDWSAKDMEVIHTDSCLLPAGALVDLVSQQAGLDTRANQLKERLCGWNRHMEGGSTAAALYAMLRSTIVRRLSEHPYLSGLSSVVTEPNAYPRVFHPWLCLKTRIGFALETILQRGLLGIDIQAVVRDSLIELSKQVDQIPKWEDLHRLTPWQALPSNARSSWLGIGGDHDCVLSSYSLPGITHNCWRAPVARYVWDLKGIGNSLWIVPFGASGNPEDTHFDDQFSYWHKGELIPVVTDWGSLDLEEEVTRVEEMPLAFRREADGWGQFTVSPISITHDLDLLYGWVRQDRARFWGMNKLTKAGVAEIYEYLDVINTHRAYLIKLDGKPVALLQTYLPQSEEVGSFYQVRDGDIGFHLLVAPTDRPKSGFTNEIFLVFTQFLFSDPQTSRLVAEPDSRNKKMLKRLLNFGFSFGQKVELSNKPAQLVFYDRTSFDSPGQRPI